MCDRRYADRILVQGGEEGHDIWTINNQNRTAVSGGKNGYTYYGRTRSNYLLQCNYELTEMSKNWPRPQAPL